MKKLLSLVTIMLLSLSLYSQVVDYTLQEIIINYEAPVEEAVLYKVVDDNYHPVGNCVANGELITVYLSEGINYALDVNGVSFLHFTVNSRDVVDSQDISLLNGKDCFFYKGKMYLDKTYYTFNE
jgi:hypothetical protein